MENPDRQKQAVLAALEEKDIGREAVSSLAVFYEMAKKWKKV